MVKSVFWVYWTNSDARTHRMVQQSHAQRKIAILKQYPQLRHLMTIDPSMKYVTTCCALTHLIVACSLSECPFGLVLAYSLIVGPLFANTLTTAMHKITHDLAFVEKAGPTYRNKIFALCINTFLAFPGIAEFYQSHKYHHSHLGTSMDIKYPTKSEALVYDGSVVSRLKFIFAHSFLVQERWNKLQVPKSDIFVFWNNVTVAIFDTLLLVYFGWKSLFYLVASSWMNDTIFVQGGKNYADHVITDEKFGLQTTSYYGWFNYLSFNLGYHREHHDFPNVPGRYLPLIRSTAMEFYSDDQYIQSSLFGALISILTAKPGQGITKHICS